MKTLQSVFIGFTLGLIVFSLTFLFALSVRADPTPPTPEQCLASGFVVIQDGTPRPLQKDDPGEWSVYKSIVAGCQRNYGAEYCPSKAYFNTSTGHLHVTCKRPDGEEA